MISTKQMLAEMETGKPFSIKRVSYNRSKKTGGLITFTEEAILYTKKKADQDAQDRVGRPLTVVEQKQKELQELKAKQPNHRKWYSRNMVLCVDGHPSSIIRKFHPPLVLEFNGIKVVP